VLTGGSAPPYAGGLNAAPCPLQAPAQYAGSAGQQQGRKLTFSHSSCANFYTSEVAPTGKLRMQSTIEGCVGLVSQTRWVVHLSNEMAVSTGSGHPLLSTKDSERYRCKHPVDCQFQLLVWSIGFNICKLYFVCSMSTTCPSNIF
jgi:hypothetical protein